MIQYYVIVHPVTNKPIEFSELPKQDMKVAISSTDSNGNYNVEFLNALCVGPVEYKPEILDKTYNPSTNQFE